MRVSLIRWMQKTSALILAALLFSACGREARQQPASPAVTDTAPREGGRLVRRLESDVSTLNYVLHTLDDERQVLAYLHDPLVAIGADLQPVPGTAARWEILDDGKAYVLHIDPRATFSDGTPVRASDVVLTILKILDEESLQFSSWFEGLDREQTKAVDEKTVRVVFDEPRVAQILTFNVAVLPEHIYGTGDFAKIDKVIGNGPYVLARRGRDRSVLLERRDDYWREKPPIASVLFRPISDHSVAWRALQRGDVDVSRVDNDLWWRIKDDPAVQQKVHFFDIYQFSYNAIVWNVRDPLFSDTRVRRALAMSFDRQAVIDQLYYGQARPVTGPFTADHWAADTDVTPIEFNLQAAAALLASAGWTDSDGDSILDRSGSNFEFSILVPAGNSPAAEQSQVLQEALRRIGVRLEITPIDDSAFFERVMNRNYQAAFLAWVNDPDPDPYALFHSSQTPPNGLNVVGYANPEADQLMERARREPDRARRADLYHQLHELLAADQPYLWTVQVGAKWAINRRVRNVRAVPGLGLFDWYPGPLEWWLQK